METSTIIILVVIAIAVVTLSLIDTSSFQNRKSTLKKLLADLHNLQNKCNSKEEAVRRDVIIRADSILSKIMQTRSINTLSFADNLKTLKHKFDKDLYNNLWKYHKLRNRIVHENEVISSKEAKLALSTFINAANKLI